MSFPFPPGFNFPPITLPPPSPVYWHPPPPPSNNDNSTIAGLAIAFGVFFVVITCACKVCAKNREDAEANGTQPATTVVVLAARPRSTPSSVPVPPDPWYDNYGEQQLRRPRSDGGDVYGEQQLRRPRSDGGDVYGEQQLRRARSDGGDEERRRPQRVSPADLPSFPYNRSVRHNVTGGDGEEEASCSVCLGAFQTGETVRLLPVCLHLFHVECIDPWLDMHSTCPICRSGIDPTTDSRLLHPPV
ncbi:unnamed protein product [Urochloa decumbens]|uniref:RING-type E3 ubiquitin transferase n=1 Tax=Urochloa decumbens TaxID=240449 RepID=A0ABC9EAR8_9POAL